MPLLFQQMQHLISPLWLFSSVSLTPTIRNLLSSPPAATTNYIFLFLLNPQRCLLFHHQLLCLSHLWAYLLQPGSCIHPHFSPSLIFPWHYHLYSFAPLRIFASPFKRPLHSFTPFWILSLSCLLHLPLHWASLQHISHRGLSFSLSLSLSHLHKHPFSCQMKTSPLVSAHDIRSFHIRLVWQPFLSNVLKRQTASCVFQWTVLLESRWPCSETSLILSSEDGVL